MTYPSENFYPAIEARRSSVGLGTGCVQVVQVASHPVAAAIKRARKAVESAIEAYTYWRNVRVTTRQLSLLDDATLHDIGLHRSQIMYVARRLALRKRRPVTGRGHHSAA